MLGHPGLDGDDRAGDRVADLGARAPVDRSLRQMEQNVDHPRALRLVEQAVEQFRVLRPDPRQGAGGREQRIESRGTHHAPLAATHVHGKPGAIAGRAAPWIQPAREFLANKSKQTQINESKMAFIC